MRHHTIRLAAALSIALAAASAGGLRAQTPARVPSVIEALDLYEQGDAKIREALETVAPSVGDGQLLAALKRVGPIWIDAAGPKAIAQRRFSVAAFALEAVRAYQSTTSRVSPALIEWACDRVRESPKPLPAERAWLQLSLVMMQTAGANVFTRHHSHAVARFGNDPKFILAEAWAERLKLDPPMAAVLSAIAKTEAPSPFAFKMPTAATAPALEAFPQNTAQEWFNLGFSTPPGLTLAEGRPGGNVALPSNYEISKWIQAGRADRTERLQMIYWAAKRQPDVAAQAELRLGEIGMNTGDTRVALEQLSEAVKHAGRATNVRYLAYFLIGQTQERLHHLKEAEQAYRDALMVLPGRWSATMALALLLNAAGRSSEAVATAEAINVDVRDPLRRFTLGDFVDAVPIIDEIRRAVHSAR